MTGIRFKVVDLFNAEPHRGLQVAVLSPAGTLPAGERPRLASELCLPLCVFVEKREGGSFLDLYSPRRPGGCSMAAALAAAALEGPGEFVTRNLRLRVERKEGGEVTACVSDIDFDAYRYRKELLCGMVGLDRYRLPDHWPLGLVNIGSRALVVPVAAPDALDELRPDYDSLTRLLEKLNAERAVFYSWRGPVDLYLRAFAPGLGVFEEPLTASGAATASALAVKERAITLSPPRTRLTAAGGEKLGRPARAELLVDHDAERVLSLTVCARAIPSFSGTF